MKKNSLINFPEINFDELSILAITDSTGFEELRTALIKDTINLSGGNFNLLTQLQNRLDQETDTEIPRYISCLHFSTWLNDSYRQLLSQADDV